MEAGQTDSYIDALCSLSLENALFIDCTANEEIGFRYPDLFHSGYSVVACNKIPFSGTYAQFRNLQADAHKAGVSLRYETTAGAALPVRGAEGALPEDGSVVRVYLEDAFWGIMQRNGDMLAWKCQIAPEERGEPTACG